MFSGALEVSEESAASATVESAVLSSAVSVISEIVVSVTSVVSEAVDSASDMVVSVVLAVSLAPPVSGAVAPPHEARQKAIIKAKSRVVLFFVFNASFFFFYTMVDGIY